MKPSITSIIVIIFILLLNSCRKDFLTIPSTGNLTFSADTIFLDTIFTGISSSTYVLKVYNKSRNDIHIPSINLGKENSFYRLNVDGMPGKSFENVPLLERDSLYIFIEATIDFSKVDNPLYTDSIVFDSGDRLQDVKLVTLVRNAKFIFPNETNTKIITGDLTLDGKPRRIRTLVERDTEEVMGEKWHFTKEKPYVIYGYCAIPKNKVLKIDAGTQLYFHDKSALIVEKNASLQIKGTLEEKVLIGGDRLEHEFSEISGQWDAIWIQKGSTNNTINNTIIRNASTGIVCNSTSEIIDTKTILTIKNTEIYNNYNYGILANTSKIIGENIVLGNNRKSSLAIKNGGAYNFNHCTFANYWSESNRINSTLHISNTEVELDSDGEPIVKNRDLTEATFTNCIIQGNNTQELFVDKNEEDIFVYFFKNCMIKYSGNSQNSLYDFTNTSIFENNLLNRNLNFKNPSVNEFQIGEESEAIRQADHTNALKTPLDITGADRTTNPDIGAYQHIILNRED